MRDQGIAELIEYLDQPERNDWSKISVADFKLITDEIVKIQNSFEYVSRNYFWISTKQGLDVLFELWPSQELLLEAVLERRGKQLPQKFFIIKARQLGFSLLLELLGLWRTAFFGNQNGMVISATPEDSAYLFQSYYLHALDLLPWWLRPMEASREIKNSVVFNNPDQFKRIQNPGLNSRFVVQGANRITGVGQGYRLNFVHASEMSDWRPEERARAIIEGDMGNALVEGWDVLGFIETTGKGAGTYSHDLWRRAVDMAEQATWVPKFFPWFMERTRVRAPEKGWQIPAEESAMAERVEREWLRCSNPACDRYYPNDGKSRWRLGMACERCATGTLQLCKLTEEQLCWMWNRRINAEQDEESLRELKQEQATTAEDAFQLGGTPVFPPKVHSYINTTINNRPLAVGLFDKRGRFHWPDPDKGGACGLKWCTARHEYEPRFVTIWEFPKDGYRYEEGVDPSEGLGGAKDYGICFMNKIGKLLREPDQQVALVRSNTLPPVQLAYQAAYLAQMYNMAEIAVEVNRLDSCYAALRYQIQYPNLWRWKVIDALNPLTNKLGWVTQENTKNRLVVKAIEWLRSESWIIRSSNFAEELKTFRREFGTRRIGAEEGRFHDDEVMAGMIALYCAHDLDYDPDALPQLPRDETKDADPEMAPYRMTCKACGAAKGCQSPRDFFKCPLCKSLRIEYRRNGQNMAPSFESIEDSERVANKGQLTYDQL